MRVALSLGVVCLLGAAARAEHDHGGPSREADAERPFGAAIGLVAARYATMLFEGDYEGIVPAVRWSGRRAGASVQLGLYRLVENGRTIYGAGDVVATGQLTVVQRGRAAAGVALAVSAPTGAHEQGLGMGHVMVMPAAWGTYAVERVTIAGSAGYGRGLGGGARHHAEHGTWPLIDPMNRAELTGSASVAVAVTRALRAGGRALGAIPIGDGEARLIAGVRAGWVAGRVETTVEVQAGVAGDPFTVRGVVETALSF